MRGGVVKKACDDDGGGTWTVVFKLKQGSKQTVFVCFLPLDT